MKIANIVPGSISLYVLLTYLTSTFAALDAGDLSVWVFVTASRPEGNLLGLQASMTAHVVFMTILTIGLFVAPYMLDRLRQKRAKTEEESV